MIRRLFPSPNVQNYRSFSWKTTIISQSDTHHQPSSTNLFPANWKGVRQKFQYQKCSYIELFFLTSPCKVILPREVLPGHSSSWQPYKSNVQRWSVCRMPQKVEQSNQIDHELQCLSRQVAKRRVVFYLICSLCVLGKTYIIKSHINIISLHKWVPGC